MRHAARLLLRSLAFAALRGASALGRIARVLAVETFTGKELDGLNVAEWERFGERPPVADDQLFVWETALFAAQVRPGDSILVVGAGTGRDALPLLRAGHAVTALDIAPGALRILEERARAEGLGVTTIVASAEAATLPPGGFDVVLFSWFSFGYIRGAEARQAALSRARAALRPGGRILISYARRGRSDSRRTALERLGSVVARLLGGVEAEQGDEFNVTGTSKRPSVYFSHVFTAEEAESEVQQAGLSVLTHDRDTPGVGVLSLVRESRSPE